MESHNYIVDLHFAFQDKHHCYFLMDLMGGADLRYYLKKRIILTEPVSHQRPLQCSVVGINACDTVTPDIYVCYRS